MKKFLLLLTLAACGDNITPTTWGSVSEELAVEFCDGLGYCGWLADADRDICIEHTAWHLCEPQHSCDIRLDSEAADTALDECRAALDAPEYFDPYSDACFFLGYYGLVPAGCNAVFDLEP